METYEDFQKFAVAIDHGIAFSKLHSQVVVGGEPWEEVLNNASDNLRLLLTEIQTSLMEMNITIKKNVNKDIIPDNVKLLCDHTSVGTYNAIVYRQFFNFFNDFYEQLMTTINRL